MSQLIIVPPARVSRRVDEARGYSRKPDRIFGYVTIAPALFVIFVIIGIPMAYAIYLSMTTKVVGHPEVFVGAKNFITIFNDPVYWLVLKNSFVFTFSSVGSKLILGMMFALTLNQRFPARAVIRVLFLVPWAVSGMVASLTWKWLYNDTYGILNVILKDLHLISAPVPWLSGKGWSMAAIIMVDVWRGTPFFIFSFLGGLQTLDKQIYEAATIDGAGVVRRFTQLTIPALMPVISVTTMLSCIWTFNQFDIPFIVTGGNPAHSTALISVYTYEVAFWSNLMGRSLSVGVSVIPIMLVFMYFASKWLLKDAD